jgi:hypothetical protein
VAEYTSEFPISYANFGPSLVDNKDVVAADHVNELRGEVLGLQYFLGRDLLLRTGAEVWDPSSPVIGSGSFSSLKDRLEWLEDGLARHNHDDRYPLLAGGSTIQPDTVFGLAIRNANVANTPTFKILTWAGDDAITLDGFSGLVSAARADLTNTADQSALSVLTITGTGSGDLISFAGPTSSSSVRSDSGFYTSDGGWIRPTSPYLQATLESTSEVGLRVLADFAAHPTNAADYLRAEMSNSAYRVRLTTNSALILERPGQFISLTPASGTLTVFNENATQRVAFSSVSNVDTVVLEAAHGASSQYGGDLTVRSRSLTTAATTVLTGGFNPTRYRGLYNPGYTRDNPISRAYIKAGTLQVDGRSENWYPLYTYNGGASDPETAGDGYFTPNYFPMSFVAPPSGEVTMHLCAEMVGMNSCAGLGWTLVRNDSGQDGATQAFAAPSYSRGVWYRSENHYNSNGYILSTAAKNSMSLSTVFLLYWLTPGVTYTVRLHGAFLGHSSHKFIRVSNIRCHLIPVLGA